MAKKIFPKNKTTRFFHSFLRDFEYSFAYFNKDEYSNEPPTNTDTVSVLKVDSPRRWRAMKIQIDYDLTEYIILNDDTKYDAQTICNGRDTGKSSFLRHKIGTNLTCKPDKKTGYVVYGEKHFVEVLEYLKKYFLRNKFLSSIYQTFKREHRTMTSKIGHMMECRILGADKTGEKQFVAMHVDSCLILDESQLIPTVTLKELYPTMEKGAYPIYAGVPNDLRTTALWTGVSNDANLIHNYATYEGINWSDARYRREIEIHGSESSPKYINLIEGCLPEGQMILTKNGMKDIKDIKIGDMVLTHKNRWRPVIKLYNFDYSGNIYKIKTAYDGYDMIITPEHPIYSLKRHNGHREVTYSEKQFLEPNKLKIGDRIVFPEIKKNKTLKKLKYTKKVRGIFIDKSVKRLKKYGVNICIGNKKVKYIGHYNTLDEAKMAYNIASWHYFRENGYFNDFDNEIEITKELMYAFGLYFAEGCCSDYHVSHNKCDKGMIINYGNKELATFFKENIESYAKNKMVKFNIYNVSNEHKIEFLRGVMDGDGCRFRSFDKGKTKTSKYSLGLSSIDGTFQIRLLLRQLGINSSVIKIKPQTAKIGERIINSSGGASLVVRGINAAKLDYLFGYTNEIVFNNEIHLSSDFEKYSTIRKIEEKYFDGKVYNFAVKEDNSYVVSDKVVHNCFGSPASSAFHLNDINGIFIDIPEYRRTIQSVENLDKAFNKLNFPTKDIRFKEFGIGIDLGYTIQHPTVVTVFGNDKSEEENKWCLVYRGAFYGGSTKVARILNVIINYFNPRFVGADGQNYGSAVIDALVDPDIHPSTFKFNQMVVSKYISNDPIILSETETALGKQVERTNRKSHAVVEINKMLDNKSICFPESELKGFHVTKNMVSLIEILQAETAKINNNRLGGFTFENNIDTDTTDAIRFFTMGLYDYIHSDILKKIKKKALKMPFFLKKRHSKWG